MKIEKVSKLLHWMMVTVFTLLIALGPIFSIRDIHDLVSPFVTGLVLAAVFYFFFSLLNIQKNHALLLCILLSVLCFAVKFLWVDMIRIVPTVDYETYFNYAKRLSESYLAPDRYVALFPHIFGYSWFLSFFMKLFGTGELVVPVINVILSVFAGILIYRIAYRLTDVRGAVFAYLLWIFCPSQTVYNSLVFSDLFYTAMILLFIAIITETNLSSKTRYTALTGILAGLVLRLVNMTRPIAVILIIAVFGWLVLLKTREWASSDFRKKWIPFLIALVLCYGVTGPAWDSYVAERLGEEGASTPGYSILVGFNIYSMGSWNIEDSVLLGNYSSTEGATAVWAQEQIMEDAKARITAGNIDFSKLFREKFKTFLGTDEAGVIYHLDVLPDSQEPLKRVCNTFYYFLLGLVFCAVPFLAKHARATSMSVVLLYVIGLIMAQMLVEVAGRYHYSVIAMLILIAPFGLFRQKKDSLRDQEILDSANHETMKEERFAEESKELPQSLTETVIDDENE